METKISVIIPVYNMEKYLAECLDSVLGQTLREIEVIAINDGSTDSSLDILKKYAALDARITVIDKENGGVAAARNDGLKAARGEFVAFMDPDDMYASSEALEHCYTAAVENGVDAAGGRFEKLMPDGSRTYDPVVDAGMEFSPKGLTNYRDYQYDYGYTCFVFRKRIIDDNGIVFPPYSRFQDPPFFVRAMIAAGRFYALDEPIYTYRILGGEGKHTPKKTLDFLLGVSDNLRVSREHGLSKLHYVSYRRLNDEGSYMISKNLDGVERDLLIGNLIAACPLVDAEWLRSEGFEVEGPIVPDVIKYALDTAAKYEKLRNRKIVRFVRKLTGK